MIFLIVPLKIMLWLYILLSVLQTKFLPKVKDVLSMKRSIVDSRNFSARYLLLDDMDVPINLHDPKDSLLRYANKFYSKY